MPQIGAIVYDSAMAFERRYQPLLSRREFVWRYVRWITVALIILTVSLAAGVCGYHFLEGIPWIDSLLNASMILGGMGPVDTLKTKAGRDAQEDLEMVRGVGPSSFDFLLHGGFLIGDDDRVGRQQIEEVRM